MCVPPLASHPSLGSGSLTQRKGEMGVAVGTDALSERAAMMRESVQKSQTISDSIVSILGSFDHRLSALETAMRPTQVGSSHSVSPEECSCSCSFCFSFSLSDVPKHSRSSKLLVLGLRFKFLSPFLFLHFLGDQTELDLAFPPYLVGSLSANGLAFPFLTVAKSGFYRLERILFEELMRILTRLWRLPRLYWLNSTFIVRLDFQ